MDKINSVPVKGAYRIIAWFALALFCIAPEGRAGNSGTPVLLFAPGAEVVRFDAVAKTAGGQAVVRWETRFETGVNAFRVVRIGAGGASEQVGLVRAQGFDEGDAYELADPSIQQGDSVRYNLFILSNYGEPQVATWEGVVEHVPEEPAPVAMAEAVAATSKGSEPVSGRKCWIGNGDRVRTWTDGAPADRVRLSLTEEGVYRVTAQELADAGGWDFSSVTNAIASTNLAMGCQGNSIAWHAEGDDALLFYGVPAESRFAPENVYWLEFGQGSSMLVSVETPGEPATTNAWFMDRLFIQGTAEIARPTYSSLADVPVSYLAEKRLLNGRSWQVAEELTDCAEGEWDGEATVNLMSWHEVGTDTHTGRVSVGTSVVGEPEWSGEKYVSFSYPFSSSNLVDGVANLKLENIAAQVPVGTTDYTRFFWISYAFSYPHLYQARNGALRCSGGTSNTVAVSGFASNEVVVLDVTITNQPVVVGSVGFEFDGVASTWTAAFAGGDSGQLYQVCSRSAGIRVPSVRGVRNVDWASSNNAADYVILVPPEGWVEGFRPVLQELADYRMAQGLQTVVVDVESLYNQFSHGLVEPQAITDFCAVGHTNWTERPLRYLLLAGDGSLDFKHARFSVDDYTACLIPTIIAGQRFSSGEGMTVSLDPSFGDWDGDGIPEVSVGRFPTPYTNEMAVVVQKTKAYEAVLLWDDGSLAKQFATVAPDWNDVPGSPSYYRFDLAVDRLIAPLEAAGRLHIPNRADPSHPNDLESVKTDSLFPALQAGTGIFHFFGHSSKYYLGHPGYYNGEPGSRLFSSFTDFSTNNWQSPTIAILIGCNPNIWQHMTTSPSTIPDGVFAANTGFVAGLGASGYLLGGEGEELGVHLYTIAAEQKTLRLGDVHRLSTKRAAESSTPVLERLHCFNLVGDPALVFRHDVTAMDTDTEWLVQHGQTAPNADLDDPDGDGWETWREFQADTNPTGYVFQAKAFQLEGDRMSVAFEAISNGAYQVEYKSSLMGGEEWQPVSWGWTNSAEWFPPETEIVPQEPVSAVVVPVSGVSTQGFYRMRGVE